MCNASINAFPRSLIGSANMAPFLYSCALSIRHITLNGDLLEALTDTGGTGHGLQANGITKLLQPPFGIVVRHDGAGDTKTGIDVVTASIGSGDGILFLIVGKIVPQSVEGDWLLRRIHVMR